MSGCPDGVRLVAASAGEDVAALAHAAGCPGCRRAMRDHLALRELARDLPAPRLDRAHRDGLGAELLARAEAIVVAPRLPPAVVVEPWVRRAVAAIALTAGALAAAAAVMTAIDPPPPAPSTAVVAVAPAEPPPAPVTAVTHVPPPPASVAPAAPPRGRARHPATVAIGDGARYDRRADASVDRIVMRDGTLTIETSGSALPVVVSGKNVRVRTGDARLSARARAGVVEQIQVFAGSVEIHTGAAVVVVSAGETWSWDDKVARAEVGAFRAGWEALKAGDFATAAAQLERAETEPGVGEDATYWAAIAWGRAGNADRARAGLVKFLDRYPNATRAGEAHLALARLLDDPAVIRAHLEAAMKDKDPRVRDAAEASLAQP